MLSRIAVRTANLVKNANFSKALPTSISAVRYGSSAGVPATGSSDDKEFTIYAESGKRFPWEGPERDVVNFPRPVQPVDPGKVRFLFIPEEWFQFFYNKTGVTGPYVLGAGVFTYVMSKELWIIEHEYYYVYASIILFAIANHKFGSKIAAFLDKEIDAENAELKALQTFDVDSLKEDIEREKKFQWQCEGQKLLVEAKKENVAIQQEAACRERAMIVYQMVKKRLEFHSQKYIMERRIQQKHMANWIVDQVLKSITPQSEKETLKKCLVDLQALASKA